ncbi:halocyanin domain-containing protein [Haloprofundus halobius]|uniref:halocyanin domain-containing protein n=1 Tax=Haloprofundus halobius TaxID=2876194 RepID=UPI001CCD86E0|nr:halocyanin domain-containing protein [Haloprofundus halobius]
MSETTRRRFLAATAGVTLSAGLVASPAVAQSKGQSDETDLSSWFDDVEGVTEIVDARGQPSVDVTVGAQGKGGAFAFDPAAVRVDPETTVVWTRTGDGGTHNVVAKDGSFESEYYESSGETFETTLDTDGVVRYACAPHETMGMNGALVVGDTVASLGGSDPTRTTDAADTPTTPTETFDGWLSNTDNYHELVDRRGESEVVVEVGTQGNGGQYAFDPPAVHVDPGTTVIWEWVGDLTYDVADPELGYHSEQVAGRGHRFAVKFDGHGLSTYDCTEYGGQGMRGVIVVGSGPTKRLSPLGYTVVGGGALLFGGPLAYGVREHFRNVTTSVG